MSRSNIFLQLFIHHSVYCQHIVHSRIVNRQTKHFCRSPEENFDASSSKTPREWVIFKDMPSGAKTNVKKYENRHESFMRGQLWFFIKGFRSLISQKTTHTPEILNIDLSRSSNLNYQGYLIRQIVKFDWFFFWKRKPLLRQVSTLAHLIPQKLSTQSLLYLFLMLFTCVDWNPWYIALCVCSMKSHGAFSDSQLDFLAITFATVIF